MVPPTVRHPGTARTPPARPGSPVADLDRADPAHAHPRSLPDLHRSLARAAARSGQSLNAWAVEALRWAAEDEDAA